MTLVNVNCTDQTLTVTSRSQITSGGVNEDRMEFSFCAKLDGYTKTTD